MEPQPQRKRLFVLILQAGLLSGVLATILSAAMVALVYGAGIEEPTSRTFRNVFEFAKAAVRLSPILAASWGLLGSCAGLPGSAWIYFRRRGSCLKRCSRGFLSALMCPWRMPALSRHEYSIDDDLICRWHSVRLDLCVRFSQEVLRNGVLRATQAAQGKFERCTGSAE